MNNIKALVVIFLVFSITTGCGNADINVKINSSPTENLPVATEMELEVMAETVNYNIEARERQKSQNVYLTGLPPIYPDIADQRGIVPPSYEELSNYFNKYLFAFNSNIDPDISYGELRDYDYSTISFGDEVIAMFVYTAAIGQIYDSGGEYNYEVGITKECFDNISMDFFGRKIHSYDNNLIMQDCETGNILSTGWGMMGTGIKLLPKNLFAIADNRYVIELYNCQYNFEEISSDQVEPLLDKNLGKSLVIDGIIKIIFEPNKNGTILVLGYIFDPRVSSQINLYDY